MKHGRHRAHDRGTGSSHALLAAAMFCQVFPNQNVVIRYIIWLARCCCADLAITQHNLRKLQKAFNVESHKICSTQPTSHAATRRTVLLCMAIG